MNLGLRWDAFRSWVPAQTKEQGQFGSAGSYPEVDAITWRGLAPRLGIAYDLAGNGKTVLKASWGRYNHSPGDSFADAYNRNTISTTTYRWSDQNRNGDYDSGEVNLDTNGGDFVTITAASSTCTTIRRRTAAATSWGTSGRRDRTIGIPGCTRSKAY